MTLKFKDIQSELHFKLQTIKNSEDREEFTKKFKEIEKESDQNDKEFITKCKQLIYEIDHESSKKPSHRDGWEYNYQKPNNRFKQPNNTPQRMTYDNGKAIPEGMSITGKKMKRGSIKKGIKRGA